MKYFALAMLGAIATTAPAADIPAEQAIEVCRTEQNALRRLTCYDSIMLNTPSSHTPAATQAAVPSKPTTNNAPVASAKQATPESQFGLEHKKSTEQAPDKVYMTVASVTETKQRELIVEFTNGQRWRQNGSGYYHINAGEQHFIKRGVLGSFFLGNDENNRNIRVKREQ